MTSTGCGRLARAALHRASLSTSGVRGAGAGARAHALGRAAAMAASAVPSLHSDAAQLCCTGQPSVGSAASSAARSAFLRASAAM